MLIPETLKGERIPLHNHIIPSSACSGTPLDPPLHGLLLEPCLSQVLVEFSELK